MHPVLVHLHTDLAQFNLSQAKATQHCVLRYRAACFALNAFNMPPLAPCLPLLDMLVQLHTELAQQLEPAQGQPSIVSP